MHGEKFLRGGPLCAPGRASRPEGNPSCFAGAINMRGSTTYWRRVLLSTVLVTLWSLFPSCSGGQDQGDFLKTETDNIKNLTIPNGSYPSNDPDKPILVVMAPLRRGNLTLP